MLLLFETPAGFSLFKVKDEGKLEDAEVRRAPPSSAEFCPPPPALCYLSLVDGWGARAPQRRRRSVPYLFY